MAGVSDPHVTIAGNLFALVRNHDYQERESLREYVLINTKRQRVECFRRNKQGLWVLQSYTPKQVSFRLDSVGFEGTLAAL